MDMIPGNQPPCYILSNYTDKFKDFYFPHVRLRSYFRVTNETIENEF